MFLRLIFLMCFWVGLKISINALPSDEFKKFVREGELFLDDEPLLKHIVPSGYPSQRSYENIETRLSDIIDTDNEFYKLFITYVEKGFTMKGLTFTVYDDNLRNAAVALFRLLQSLDNNQAQKVIAWAKRNINRDLLSYAWQLNTIYSNKKKILSTFEHEPPYTTKPNYFINGETIKKALQLLVDNGQFSDQEAFINQFFKKGDVITINTNYSGWNLPSNGCHEDLNYFREDIGINSYYVGLQLLHPFWMSNSELEEINPRHAEYYYFAHKQLMARYNLEREYLRHDRNKSNEKCFTDYNPYLYYDNGLPFPIRSSTLKEWNGEQARIKSIDIAIKECISRRVIFMDNGTKIPVTEDNYIDLLAKILRANLDGIKSAKFVRSFFGYGGNTYPANSYNPAPSVLHHAETSLRDPIYWYLIQNFLNYFNEFERTLEPFDISKYEYNDINIINADIPKVTTYFSYFQFTLNKGLENTHPIKKPYAITARLRRLNHADFSMHFRIESRLKKQVALRLFLGPECSNENCWILFPSFFELDLFNYELQDGINNITWPLKERSSKFSFENFYNMEEQFRNVNRYNMFKFPINLIIPRGLEYGLNLTLFIIITPTEDSFQIPDDYFSYYEKAISEVFDKKPLGFPFHREATNFKSLASNYRFLILQYFIKRQFQTKKAIFLNIYIKVVYNST